MKLSVGLFALFATAHAGSYTDETYYNPTCVAPYSLAWSEPMAIADMTSDDFQKKCLERSTLGTRLMFLEPSVTQLWPCGQVWT